LISGISAQISGISAETSGISAENKRKILHFGRHFSHFHLFAAIAATLLPHLRYHILKAFQQICGSSGSNFVKNKKI